MNDSTPATSGKLILVIDDNRVVLTATAFVLRGQGYRVVLAETGADALVALRKERPDLILLDLDFPPDVGNVCAGLRDGFLIIDWARRMGNAEGIPIIIVSALDPEQYKAKAHAAGIPTFFRKPVDKEKLVAAVAEALGKLPNTTTG